VRHHASYASHQASDPTMSRRITPVVTDDATIAIHSYSPFTSFVVDEPKKSSLETPGMSFLDMGPRAQVRREPSVPGVSRLSSTYSCTRAFKGDILREKPIVFFKPVL
jgi:hypothetical protein